MDWIFMKKIISLMVVMFVYILPVLTTPAYAASHAKVDSATTDAKKKKPAEEDEEPDCD